MVVWGEYATPIGQHYVNIGVWTSPKKSFERMQKLVPRKPYFRIKEFSQGEVDGMSIIYNMFTYASKYN